MEVKGFIFEEDEIVEGLHMGNWFKVDDGEKVFIERTSYEKIARFIPDDDIELILNYKDA